MDIERRLIRNVDWPLALTTLGLVCFGLLAIYSATYALVPGDPFYYVKRQIVGALVGVIGAGMVMAFDYHSWERFTRLAYIFTLLLLALVVLAAPTIMGAGRWIILGPVSFQPSEFAKIAIIVTLADHLARKQEVDHPFDLVSPLLHVALPMALILVQPDLGTAIVFAGILFGMLYVRGYPVRHLAALAAGGVAAFGLAVFVSSQGWLSILKDYQLRRLLVFLDPYTDRTGAGWNVIQSMIAVGSGGFFGKGLFAGSQTQLDFLPARHTDFIFSVVAEELGFLGAFLLLAGYFFLLWRAVRLMSQAKDEFGALLIVGVVSMLFFHVVINVGMTLGVMPVTGLPLPFASAGGSSLITNMAGVAIILNVHMRRHKILF